MTLLNKQCIQQTAIVDSNGNCIRYGDIYSFAKDISNYLQPRSLVFCLCKNEIGSILGYISFLENKVVPLLLDASKDAELLDTSLDIYKPNYIWMPEAQWNGSIGKQLFSAHDYVLVEYSIASIKLSEDLGLLLTTSGSTGSPKLVRLSYENIHSNAEAIGKYLHITAQERPITSLPMYYSYGLSVINSHLLKGATILLTDRPVIQKEFWTFAKEQEATSIAGVPYTYEMLKRLRIFQLDLPSLTTFTQAGGKLSPLLAKEYIEKACQNGKQFIIMYGQTEATARMSYLPWEKAAEKFDSIGIAIPGGSFELIDEEGKEITTPEAEGELVYAGNNVSLGYAECPKDLALENENKGILHTGDIARRDKDGFYYITGRMKRFVKIWGNRVNLDATEQLVKAVTSSCACVGIDDQLTIFTSDPGKEEEIKSVLVHKTGLNGRAFTVKLIDCIPKNTSGKIQYTELMKLL